jgi:type I restriction enzyme S subunit
MKPDPSNSQWKRVRLGEIAKTSSGGTPSRGVPAYYDGDIPWVKSGELGDSTVYDTQERITRAALASSSAKLFPKGTLCIALYGATVGKLGILGVAAATNQAVCGIFLPPEIDTRFAYRYLESRRRDLVEMGKGGAQSNISQQIIRELDFPFPPLPTQRSIVAEIEKQFTRLDAGVAALRRVQANLKRYRAAVLKAACEGRLVPTEAELARAEGRPFESGQQLLARILTERRQNWQGRGKYKEPASLSVSRHEPESLPEGWAWATPEQLSSSEPYSLGIGPFGSNLKVSDYTTEGVPLIFVRNIRPGRFVQAKEVHVTDTKAEELKAHQASGGDILITKMGAPPGDACLYPNDAPKAVITADCIKFRPSSLLSERRYFVHAINSDVVKPQILDITKGVAQMKVSLGRFETIAIPLPPLAEQTRIVAEVERRLTMVEELEAVVTLNLQRATRLRQAVLQKAFSGNL